MSEHWEQFPCTMGDHEAFIAYDHGIKDELQALPFASFARFAVELKDPDYRGLPRGGEFDQLNKIEDSLAAKVQEGGGVQVGRITANGRRYFYFYTSLSESECKNLAEGAASLYGHVVNLDHEADPERSRYWTDLYPTEDDWQVIQDIRVQQALVREGDSLQTPRPIDHWAYFQTEKQRASFIAAVRDSFEEISLLERTEAQGGQLCVRLNHVGLPDYQSMNKKTIMLGRVARECGGSYDGWEAEVCRS